MQSLTILLDQGLLASAAVTKTSSPLQQAILARAEASGTADAVPANKPSCATPQLPHIDAIAACTKTPP